MTAKFCELENQDASILSAIEILERIRPKVESFMNGKWYPFFTYIYHVFEIFSLCLFLDFSCVDKKNRLTSFILKLLYVDFFFKTDDSNSFLPAIQNKETELDIHTLS